MTRILELQSISAAYGAKRVVHKVSFSLEPGEIGCLLGPSGCGKTTILRTIAGFEPVVNGEIHLHEQMVSCAGWTQPTERRQVGMVFQDFALFPHLTIGDNVGFGITHLPTTKSRSRVRQLLELVGLGGYENHYPHQLSGGQQQRVALARAVAPKPNLLLMDEPFSSMDAELREQLAAEVREILKHEQISAILVTHNQFEAFAMADQIGVIHDGRLLQWDSAYNLYHQPADRFVADFIGQGVFLPGIVLNNQEVRVELGIIKAHEPVSLAPGSAVDVLVRPDDIVHDDRSTLLAEVETKAFRGAEFMYSLGLISGTKLLCIAPSHHDHQIGERIGIVPEIDHLVMFPGTTK